MSADPPLIHVGPLLNAFMKLWRPKDRIMEIFRIKRRRILSYTKRMPNLLGLTVNTIIKASRSPLEWKYFSFRFLNHMLYMSSLNSDCDTTLTHFIMICVILIKICFVYEKYNSFFCFVSYKRNAYCVKTI